MVPERLHPARVLRARPVRDFLLATFGLALTAWALDAFLIPHRIAAGGVSGLSTIIHHWSLATFGVAVPVGVQMLFLNGVLLLVAVRVGGLRYAAKTIYGIVMLSVFIDAFAPFVTPLAGDDLLLAALFGGALSGVGIGMVFKTGANTGGTDILAQLMARRLPFGVGQILFVIDAGVTTLAAFAFGPRLALYGAVTIFVMMMAIDVLLEGVSVEKAVWIMSDHHELIGEAITNDLGRGATRLSARGVWTGEERGMLFVVLSRNELDGLKQVVNTLDPGALVIISNVHEAIGEGFKEMRIG